MKKKKYKQLMGDLYQVVGTLATKAEVFDTDEVQKILDILAEYKKYKDNILPFNI